MFLEKHIYIILEILREIGSAQQEFASEPNMLELMFLVRKSTHIDSTFARYLRIPILEIKKEDIRHMPLNGGKE